MSVVCVKVASIRPKYHNLREWCNDPNNVYIGRRGIVFIDGVRYPPGDSTWANPYKVKQHGDRNEVIRLYKIHLKEILEEDASLRQEFIKLKGKTLGCWCKPESCHGDVILEMLNDY